MPGLTETIKKLKDLNDKQLFYYHARVHQLYGLCTKKNVNCLYSLDDLKRIHKKIYNELKRRGHNPSCEGVLRNRNTGQGKGAGENRRQPKGANRREVPAGGRGRNRRLLEDAETGERVMLGKHANVDDSNFDPIELKVGIEVEKEHTDDPALAKEIAKDHLAEIKDYYTRLVVMELNSGVDKDELKEVITTLSDDEKKEFLRRVKAAGLNI